MKKRFLIVLSILLVLPLVYAQTACFFGFECADNETCVDGLCQLDLPANQTPTTTNFTQLTPAVPTEYLLSLYDALAVQDELTQEQINELTAQIQTINQQLQSLSTTSQSLNSKLDQTTGSVNSVSTGLASLQNELSLTQEEISTLENQVQEAEKSQAFAKQIFFLVLFLIVFAGAVFYIIHYKKSKLKPSSDLKRHIYQNIKKGQTFANIRKKLLQAGHPPAHIDNAYKEVLTYNYNKYQKQQPKPKVDKEKIIIISVVTIIILLGLFFLIQQGVLGKAIQFQRNFAQDEPFICTPPHITTEGGCCLDLNENQLCDFEEEYEKKKAAVSAEFCSDHNQCAGGTLCINNKCGFLDDLYNTDCTGKKCNLNQIKIVTSDGETYELHPQQGSYTAAGALSWTILPLPNYCQGEPVFIPLEIEKTDLVCYDSLGTKVDCTQKDVVATSKIEIISKEIITLAPKQTTPTFTHSNPNINQRLADFSLTFLSANQFCFS